MYMNGMPTLWPRNDAREVIHRVVPSFVEPKPGVFHVKHVIADAKRRGLRATHPSESLGSPKSAPGWIKKLQFLSPVRVGPDVRELSTVRRISHRWFTGFTRCLRHHLLEPRGT